ncbi:MAG: hypothetical protein ACOYVF_09735 [Candidatus Zixiibacteriota bacterium]
MRFKIFLIVALALAIFSGCIERRTRPPLTKESVVSVELLSMVEEDQQMRYHDTLDAAVVAKADRVHRERIFELLAAGEITEPNNLFYAAVILQNADSANCSECFLIAYYLATRAVELGLDEARSLAATSLDRYLVLTGKPQKYGTQIGKDSLGKSYIYTIDSLTTDSMRRLWDVPSLDSLKAKVATYNQEEGY